MKKREVIRFFSLLFFAAILLNSVQALSNNNDLKFKKPNIIFVLADDMAVDDVEYMPNLKTKVLEKGINFKNYFVGVPLCCPSRTTTLRGQYSHNTGVKTNNYPDGGFLRFRRNGLEKSTIATWLKAAGYNTGLIGKYLNGIQQSNPRTYVPPGWLEWASPINLFAAYSGFGYTLNENGVLVRYGSQKEDYGTDVYARKARRFIKHSVAEKRPFFLFLSVVAPHAPAIPAPRHAELFPGAIVPRTPAFNEVDVTDKPKFIQELPLLDLELQSKLDRAYRRRVQSLQAVDEAIGSLYATLTLTKQLNNTYIFFASDNGFMLGQHRLPGSKSVAYEESIRVPLIVRGPGIPANRTSSHLVGNTDLAPTFASLARAHIPSFVDGRSLLPLLRKSLPSLDGWRQSYLLEHWPESRSPRHYPAEQRELTLEEQYVRHPKAQVPIPEFHGIRTYDYSYVEYMSGERELYDLKVDPYQLDNIAATADINLLNQLSAKVNALKTCRGKTCVTLENEHFGSSR